MAILEGGHIVPPPPHSSYIQKPLTIRVKKFLVGGKEGRWQLISVNSINIELDNNTYTGCLKKCLFVRRTHPVHETKAIIHKLQNYLDMRAIIFYDGTKELLCKVRVILMN